MGFTLERVVPWGRSFIEYCAMFGLTEHDAFGPPASPAETTAFINPKSEIRNPKLILGCADGPASFNAEATARGWRVISSDPVYRASRAALAARIDETSETVMDQLRRNAADYVWTHFDGPEDVSRTRLSAMRRFLDDFATGKAGGRYVTAGLPALPFAAGSFDLALCSHFLFLYSEQFSLEFHVAALREMCRVAREVRVFPLADLAGRPSPHLDGARRALARLGLASEITPVPYEFQRGVDRMLRIAGTGSPGAQPVPVRH